MNDPPRIGWLAEAIKLMYATAVQASSVQVEVSKELGQAFISHCGKKEVVDLPPPSRDHKLATLDDLKTAVNLWCNTSCRGVLWAGLEKCVLVLDDAKQRDRATLYLTISEKWSLVKARLQRSSWNDSEDLTALCKTLDGTGMESLLSKITPSDLVGLPSFVDLNLPMLVDSPLGTLTHRVTCGITVGGDDNDECSIAPRAGQIQLAESNALGQLYTHLDTLLKDEQAAHKVVLIKGSPE